jgi:nitrite reductase/ring-hydroxylating ferredoxin subunit
MARVPLCRLDQLHDDQLLLDVPGQDEMVLVVRDGLDVHVVEGHCPHQFAPLLGGQVEACVLTCPVHGWRFDLRTGVSPDSPFLRVRRWPAQVEAGVVWIDTGPDEP